MALTAKRRLKGGRSLWQARRMAPVPTHRMAQSSRFDVVVVGAGISGALVAESLSDQGLSVAIVDRRGPLQGSTPASTALLQYEIDTPLSKLSQEIGKERAQRIWRRSRLALDALRERARHLGVEADCVNRDSLYLDGDVLGPRKLFEEYLARREAGFETTHLDERQVRQRFGIKGRTAILGYDNMAADPRRLAAGFLRKAIERGAKMFAPHEIVDVATGGPRVVLETADGLTLRAGAAVFATGYEFLKGVPKKGHTIASTWALATKPQPRRLWPEQCFIWEASDPYLYLRVSPDNRVICGGCDAEFADEDRRDGLMEEKIEAIRAKMSALLPNLDTRPDYRWCGNFGASETGTPTIGPVPRMKNCYALMGYGGNGITFSMMGAQLLTSMLTGRADPDADLFSFSRSF